MTKLGLVLFYGYVLVSILCYHWEIRSMVTNSSVFVLRSHLNSLLKCSENSRMRGCLPIKESVRMPDIDTLQSVVG